MIILGILAVCMGSCTDLLDKEPISQLSVNNLLIRRKAQMRQSWVVTVSCINRAIIGKSGGCLRLKEPIYQGTVVVRPIINGLPVKTVGAIGGSRPIRRFVLAM